MVLSWSPLLADDIADYDLFFSFSSSTAEGYRIWLTDCTQIWTEELSKGSILQKARVTNCSIDPSQDDSQLQHIYDKILETLSNKDDTTLFIDFPDDEQEGRILVLHVKCKLPSPLRAFKWRLQLQKCEPEYLRSKLIVPLVGRIHNLQQQVDQLSDTLADKDEALSRILDKIESSGNDPGTIFPAAARSRSGAKITKNHLLQTVKGLKPFNREQWKASFQPSDVPGTNQMLLASVLKGGSHQTTSVIESSTRENVQITRDTAALKPKVDDNSETGSETDEDCQRQATPPQFKRSSPSRSSPISTPSRNKHSEPTVAGKRLSTPDKDPDEVTTPSHRRIGRIGGPKPSKSRSPTPDSSSLDAKKLQPPLQSAVTEEKPSPLKGPRLGKIGGQRSYQGDVDNESTDDGKPSVIQEAQPAMVVQSPGKPKTRDVAFRSQAGDPKDEQPSLTDDQKADEKRLQLKRQLEANKKARNKKTRRF